MKLTGRSRSAEMQTPLGVHDASGRMLTSGRKWLRMRFIHLLRFFEGTAAHCLIGRSEPVVFKGQQ